MILVLLSFFIFAKDPISLQPEKEMPKAPQNNELDLKQFKNVELKKESKPFNPSSVCTSTAGVEYKAGTESYDSCLREQNRYTPPGYDPYKKNK